MSPTKKYVIIGVTAFFLIGIVIAAILVGMHIFAQSQKDILEVILNLSSFSVKISHMVPNKLMMMMIINIAVIIIIR